MSVAGFVAEASLSRNSSTAQLLADCRPLGVLSRKAVVVPALPWACYRECFHVRVQPHRRRMCKVHALFWWMGLMAGSRSIEL